MFSRDRSKFHTNDPSALIMTQLQFLPFLRTLTQNPTNYGLNKVIQPLIGSGNASKLANDSRMSSNTAKYDDLFVL